MFTIPIPISKYIHNHALCAHTSKKLSVLLTNQFQTVWHLQYFQEIKIESISKLSLRKTKR